MFKKLFNIFKDKNHQTTDDIKKNMGILQRVDDVITSTTKYCYENTCSFMKLPNEDANLKIYLYYEYLYLFRHLVLRAAFTKLSFAQIKILHEYIAGTCTPAAVSAFLSQYPELSGNQKQGSFFYKSFFSKIDEMEVYLSASREILGDENALIPKIGNKISGMIGVSDDPALIAKVIQLITYAYQSMKTDQIVGQAQKYISVKAVQ
ncbi:MAG: hypothetical protein H6Q65_1688 [Firmicutes bacterium]|nr:hypothetical protein [Bacillota bacterium]